jgi:hypothetical protein
MNRSVSIHVKRDQFDQARIEEGDLPAPETDQVLVAVDKFALTANNVTYAVAGDMVGYWQFYPVGDDWGIVPVWGIGEVVASGNESIPVGERLYGFFPMASHALLTLGEVTPGSCVETSDQRRELPAVYNSYRRTAADPEFLQAMEDERCLYFPLFMTSYLIYDFLQDKDFFGAKQILIGSASSKTAFGLAKLLRDCEYPIEVIGITSPSNRQFVDSLEFCDGVLAYGEEEQLDATIPSVFVDMSGDGKLTAAVHGRLQDQLRYSCAVGATHWESFGTQQELPGPEPVFFFAPAQIVKRDEEWGSGVLMARAAEAVADVIRSVAGGVEIHRVTDSSTAVSTWQALVANQVPPSRGIMVSLTP